MPSRPSPAPDGRDVAIVISARALWICSCRACPAKPRSNRYNALIRNTAEFPIVDAARLSEDNRLVKRGAQVHPQLFATVGLLQDWEVALLDTAGPVARHQQDRQARTQHPRSSGELEPVDAALHHNVAYQ
jgi:hypothetical protein